MFRTELKSSKPHHNYNVHLNFYGARDFTSWLKKLTHKKISITLKSDKDKAFTFNTIKERKAFASSFDFMYGFMSGSLQELKNNKTKGDATIRELQKNLSSANAKATDTDGFRGKYESGKIIIETLNDRLAEVEDSLNVLTKELGKKNDTRSNKVHKRKQPGGVRKK